MPSIINSSTTSGLIATGSTDGSLALQTANTTALTISSGQIATFVNPPVMSLTSATGKLSASNMPTGSVLQVVQGTSSTEVGISTGTATDTGLSVSITPLFSTSKILVIVTQEYLGVAPNGNTYFDAINIVRNSTTIYSGNRTIGLGVVNSSGTTQTIIVGTFAMSYLDSPATTSATTYKTQASCGTTGSTYAIYLQNNSSPSYITAMEIAA